MALGYGVEGSTGVRGAGGERDWRSPWARFGRLPSIAVVPVRRKARFRSAQLLASVLRWLAELTALYARGLLSRTSNARAFRALLERMGGLWIKAGQILALRRDFFSNEFCAELARLQDRALGFPVALVRRIIQEELGQPLHQVFDTFEDAPIAAASIAQVHYAVLRQEKAVVAVKVQRPHASSDFERDLRLIRRVFWTCDRLRIFPHLRWLDMVWELEQVFREEVDYRLEAASIHRMRVTLNRHEILVPRVFRRYSTSRVLVMEYVEGVLMSEYIQAAHEDPGRLRTWLRANNIQPAAVGRRLYLSMLRQLFEDNLFHGDLHPGNIVLLRDSAIALIDFGTVGRLDVGYLKTYRIFVRALAEGEFEKAADMLLLLCSSLPPVDLNEVREELVRAMRVWHVRAMTPGLDYHERSVANNMTELGRVLFKYRIWMSWSFLKINRTHLTLDSSLMHLLPNANYPSMLQRYFAEALDRGVLELAKAQTIKETVVNEAAGLREALRWAGERWLFEDVVWRRAIHRMRPRATNMAYAFGLLFANLSGLIALIWVALVLAWVAQRHPGSLPARIEAILRIVPELSATGWLGLLALGAYFYVLARQLGRTLMRPEYHVGPWERP